MSSASNSAGWPRARNTRSAASISRVARIEAIGANFHGSNFTNAKMPNMTAWGSDWSGTHAPNVKLSGGYFQNANFYNAYLYEANFNGADISGANFKQATLDGADLCNTVRNPAPQKDSGTTQVGTKCPI